MTECILRGPGWIEQWPLEALAEKVEWEWHLFEKVREWYYLVSFKNGKYGFFTIDGWLQWNKTFKHSTYEFNSISECEIGDDITIEFGTEEELFSLKIWEAGLEVVEFQDATVTQMLGILTWPIN